MELTFNEHVYKQHVTVFACVTAVIYTLVAAKAAIIAFKRIHFKMQSLSKK